MQFYGNSIAHAINFSLDGKIIKELTQLKIIGRWPIGHIIIAHEVERLVDVKLMLHAKADKSNHIYI